MSYDISVLGLVSEVKMILNYVTIKGNIVQKNSEGVALNVEETNVHISFS